MLIDKTPALVFLGLLGLCLYPIVAGGHLVILLLVAVMPWFMGALFLSTPRILEPTLPLVLFGNVLCVSLLFHGASTAMRGRLGK